MGIRARRGKPDSRHSFLELVTSEVIDEPNVAVRCCGFENHVFSVSRRERVMNDLRATPGQQLMNLTGDRDVKETPRSWSPGPYKETIPVCCPRYRQKLLPLGLAFHLVPGAVRKR
jgi:hypothetical protein